MKSRTLLNLSGGLDSTYCAWKWLTDNPDKSLLLHHCDLRTNQNRHSKENQAVEGILNYLDFTGLTNYEFIETVFDIREIGYRPLDGQVIAFMNGIMLISPKYKDITHTIICTPKNEYDRLGNLLNLQQNSYKQIRNIVRHTFKRQQPRNQLIPIYMVNNMTKHEIYNATPKALRELSWSCRTPNKGEPCQKCHTCKQLMV